MVQNCNVDQPSRGLHKEPFLSVLITITFPSDAYAYTFSIYLTDFNGYTSNQAVATFFVP